MQSFAANLSAEISLADTWPGAAILFALFLLFFAATLGYGWLLAGYTNRGASRFLTRVSDAYLLGSLTLYVSAFALSSLHALALFPGWLWAAAFLPGLAAFVPLARAAKNVPVRGAAALYAFVFLLRATLSFARATVVGGGGRLSHASEPP
jgi:hypothetical protein